MIWSRFAKWLRKRLARCCGNHVYSDEEELYIKLLKRYPDQEPSSLPLLLELLNLEYTQLCFTEKVIEWMVDNEPHFHSEEPHYDAGYDTNDIDAMLATNVGSYATVGEMTIRAESDYFDCASTLTDSSYCTCLDA